MKYFICSDLHGSASACQKVIENFYNLNCDKILLLGDVLYHGPRNDLPAGYAPKKVIELLNPLAQAITACRGNCDAEVDQMVLNFDVSRDYFYFTEDKLQIFGSHGHIYAPLLANDKLPAGCESASKNAIPFPVINQAVFLYGHTHVPVLEKNPMGYLVCNPGSTSIPKGGSEPGFAILENHKISLHNLQGQVLKELEF